MKKTILAKAAGRVLKEYGRKWGRSLGELAVSRACEALRRRGLTDRQIDLETLREELRQMHAQGRLSRDELSDAFKRLRKARETKR